MKNNMRDRECANAEGPRSDIERVFSESKMGLLAGVKTDSSPCSGIHQDACSHLIQLGSPTPMPQSPQEANLEVIPNRWPGSDYTVHLLCEEFTCLCPMTSQPDFAKIIIDYRPDQHLIESKSLKLYLGSYRNVGIFHEFVINAICHDLVQVLHPKSIEVKGEFSVRGGIRIIPVARWTPPTGINA